MEHIVEAAAREVIETTAGLALTTVVKPTVPERDFHGIVGTVSLVGSKGGTLVVFCHIPAAKMIAAAMMGVDEPDDETVCDALGEVVNQIAGTIKRSIGANGNEIMLTVPVVVAGSPLAHSVRSEARPVTVELRLGDWLCFVCLWPSK